MKRCSGERGTAMVAALVILFAMTAGAVIWLARDVDTSVSNRSTASSVAFQAARTGAQQVRAESLRGGGERVVLDGAAARERGEETARLLLAEYHATGTVGCVVSDVNLVVCTVVIAGSRGAADATGSGAARAETGP